MAIAEYLTNAAQVAAIGTSFAVAKKLTLEVPSAAASWDGPPSGAALDRLQIAFTVDSGSPTTIEAMLCEDAACDVPVAGPSQTGVTFAAQGAAGGQMCSISLAPLVLVWPYGQQARALYLLLKVDAGAITVPAGSIKLPWSISARR